MRAIFVGVLFLCVTLSHTSAADTKVSNLDKKVVCYYTNWSFKRPKPFQFTPDQIDPFLCTHIIYAFADIGSKNNIVPSKPEFDFNQHAYANITGLKKANKNLKVMIGIGGWGSGSIGFGIITANETNRKEFAKNAVRFIRGYKFDGLDLNWQHPTFREGGTSEDKANYVLLSQTLREEFEREAAQKNKPRLLLSIAISHNLKFLPGYDIPGFNNYMDFISVICYDYHFSYETAVYHHSPLYSLEEDNEYNYDADVNINYTIKLFMELADSEKLILGIPSYGRTYTLENPEETAIGSYADGAGNGGPVTNERGWFAHFEICNFVKNENWTVVQTKPGSAGPYAYKGNQWVCYDDYDMIRTKANYANEKGLGGVMFWTVDYDDYLGRCEDQTFPLIRAARDALITEDPMVFPVESDTAALEQNEVKTRAMIKPVSVQEDSPASLPDTPTKEVSITRPSINDIEKPKAPSANNKVVCYYTNWSYKRPAPFDFTPNKIDPFLCTHIIYAFADIGSRNNLVFSDPEFDLKNHAYANITGLKQINKNLKVMIGIGGWAKGSLGFGQITANDSSRKEFAKNAVRFIRGYMFDGLDLNWQHPTFREGGTAEDKANYVLLAQTLREEFEREAEQKNKPRLLLSIAISHNLKFLPAYDIPGFNNYMDFISVICYDYHFAYETEVNHHSPLYILEEDNDYNYDADININYTINYFMELADSSKLVLGIPAYGRTYTLDNPEETAIGSTADGPGNGGPVTNEKGWFAHFEICNFVKNENWTVVQTKPGSAGPYAYKGNQWVCYDDYDMIRNKAKYAMNKGLGGVMFWTMDYDDFFGRCQEEKFPLIRAARDALIPEGAMINLKDPQSTKKEGIGKGEETSTVNKPKRPFTRPPKPAPKELKPSPTSPVTPRIISTTSPPIEGTKLDLFENTDSTDPQPNLVGDLIRLIEKAGGADNFSKLLLQDKTNKARIIRKQATGNDGDTENTIIFQSPHLPPILVLLSNSSVHIEQINVRNEP